MLVGFNHLDLDVVAQQVVHHLGVVRRSLGGELAAIHAHTLHEHCHQDNGDDYPEQKIFCQIVQTGFLILIRISCLD
jgi:hypothetical protein